LTTTLELRCAEYCIEKAFDYEADYFDEHPDGDGAIDAAERRMLLARWWNEAFKEAKSS
jgi:hypothetical protein